MKSSRRVIFLAVAAALTVAGLAFRFGPWTPPLPFHHYGGGFLWGGMVYALVTLES